MAQYHFDMPEGWVCTPLAPPQLGVEVRPKPDPKAKNAPIGQDAEAQILLRLPIPTQGSLQEALLGTVQADLAGRQIIRQAQTLSFSGQYPGLLVAVRLRNQSRPGAPPLDEGRIYALLDAGVERIPVVFIGGEKSLPVYRDALDQILTSLRPSQSGPDSPFAGFAV